MIEYRVVPFEEIRNNNGFFFYKLMINGECHYDYFVKEIEKLPNEQRSLRKVLTLMERFSPKVFLMNNRIRQIQGLKRKDVFEFKDPPCVRLFVVLDKPNIYVVSGSTKNGQKAAIRKLDNLLRDFN